MPGLSWCWTRSAGRHADDVVLREQFVLERPLHAVRPARGDRALQVALQRTVRHAVVAPVLVQDEAERRVEDLREICFQKRKRPCD